MATISLRNRVGEIAVFGCGVTRSNSAYMVILARHSKTIKSIHLFGNLLICLTTQ